jgi:hypothetical protein
MPSVPRNNRGIALGVAMFALVVVGALVAAAFFAGMQEQRLGENQRGIHTAFSMAETGAYRQLMIQDPQQLSLRPGYPDDSIAIGPDLPAPDGIGRYGGHAYKVGPNLLLIDITAQDTAGSGRAGGAGGGGGGGGASQRIGLIARIGPSDSGLTVALLRSRGWLHLF